MTKIKRLKDCGNSPKNIFVQEFVIALLLGQANKIKGKIEKDIIWSLTPAKTVKGSPQLLSKMHRIDGPDQIDIHHVLTHGKLGSVAGLLRDQKGKEMAFCHIIEFSSAAAKSVRKITSYKA